MSKIRTGVLTAGLAALLSSQAAYAAPAFSRTVDPLVSLSALASTASRAAVCAGSTAAASGSAAAAAAAQAPGAGCVLPVTAAPAPPPVVQPAPAPLAPVASGPGIGTLPLLLGLAAIIGIAALVLSNNGHNKGNVTPVSPA